MVFIGRSAAQEAGAPAVFRTFFRSPDDSVEVRALLASAEEAVPVSLDSAMRCAGRAYRLTTSNVRWNDHPLLDSCYMFFTALLIQAEALDKALLYADSAVLMGERLYPDGNAALIDQYYFRSHLNDRLERLEPALSDMRKAVALMKKLGYGNDPSYANMYWSLGWLEQNKGRFASADSLFMKSLELKRQTLDPESAELADFLYHLAIYYQNEAAYERADGLFAEALSIYREDTSVSKEALIGCVQSMASHYAGAGKFEEAKPLYDEAEAYYRSLPGGDSERLGSFLVEEGDFYRLYGKYGEAEKYLFEGLGLLRKEDGRPTDALMHASIAAAFYYNARGMHADAEPYYLDAIEAARELHGEASVQHTMTMNNLGTFYISRGRYKEASRLLEKAYNSIQGEGFLLSKAVFTVMNNFAVANEELGNIAKAESLYTASYRLTYDFFPENILSLATINNNVGEFYASLGKTDSACKYLSEAVRLYRKAYSEPHPSLAVSLNNLAKVYAQQNEPGDAEDAFEEALEMRRALFAMPHPDLLNSLRHFGEFLSSQGETEEALAMFRELLGGIYQRLRESFEFESEGSQLDFLTNIIQPNLDAVARFCLANRTEPGVPGMFLDALLKLKGAVANEGAQRTAELSKNAMVLKLNKELTALREQQAAYASRRNTPEVESDRSRIRTKAEMLDAALRKVDREYEKLARRNDASWLDIQKELRSGEALVEYSAVPMNDRRHDPERKYVYTAVVLRSEGEPVMIGLCDEQALLPYLAAQAKASERSSYVLDPARSAQLAARIWTPLEEALQDIRRIHISPDGMLYRLAFGALALQQEPLVYLDDRYELHYLCGARQLLDKSERFKPNMPGKPQRFVLLGAPDFSAVLKKKPHSSSKKRTRGGWEELPGTAAELNFIAAACAEKKIPCNSYTGKRATEDTVKALSGNAPRVLHLATHGFFFSAVEAEDSAYARRRSERSGASQLRIIDNPMLRSGLILSGANAVWTGDVPAAGSNDGILTALEVSRLDLTGTELVTLSACETGLGDVRNGEGIFGLQRAFQVAGAETVIMSLWKVADEATAEMMKLFYERWLAGVSKTEAFRAARLEIRKRYPSPYIWAAFVMIGG